MSELKAGVGRCEEASMLSHTHYIPCNVPAVSMVAVRGEGPYRMCEACAYHNTKNRGGAIVGPYDGAPPEDIVIPADQLKKVADGLWPRNDLSPEDLSAYVEDSKLDEVEKGNILSQITNTVRQLRDVEEDVKQAEAMLRAAQERRKQLAEVALPLLMDEAQQKRLTTLDGWEVTRSEVVRASIPPDKLGEAITWLTDNGQGAIIKRDLSLKFGKGEEKEADKAVSLLTEAKYFPTDKMSVHPMTLASVVKELLEEGKEVPLETLGVYIQPVVRIKEGKR